MKENFTKLLRDNLRDIAGDTIYNRGMDYYRSGHIESLRAFFVAASKDKIRIKGEVSGTDDYRVSMIFDLRKRVFSELDCDCPCDFDCKHSVAIGLEFIDIFVDFLNQFDDYNNDIGDLRKGLTEWINSKVLAKEYAFDRNDEIIEDKEADSGNYKNITRRELMDELKIALNSGQGKTFMIDKLVRELASRKKEHKLDSAAIPQKFIKKEKRFNPEDHHIIIEKGYNNNLNIEIKKNRHVFVDIKEILTKCKNLTETQKELFSFLKSASFYYNDINYQRLFNLFRNSGIKIYLRSDDEKQELIFKQEREDGKIKARLSLRKKRDEYSGEIKKEFIFKLNSNYDENNSFLLFLDKKHAIKIENKNVSFHKLSKSLIKLLSRIKFEKNHYNYYEDDENFFKTILNEFEILKINQIIKDCEKHLNFQSKLKSNFQITKFTSADPCMLIDYNNEKDLLEVKATINYGFKKIDVRESVNRSSYKGMDEFKRMKNSKYIIDIGDKAINYAFIKNEKEIQLYKQFCYYGKECGFKKNVECKVNGEENIFKYFSKCWENLQNLGYKIEFIHDKFEFAKESFNADFNVDLNAENDWLGFDVSCYCGKDKVSLNDLKKYIEDKKEFIKLNNGKILKITNWDELEQFVMMLESFYAKEENKFEGKLYHATELENIFTSSEYYNSKVEESFKKFIEEVKRGKPVKKAKLPAKFNKILRGYQKDGIDWFHFLRKYRFAGILADDMGLGKTLQALVLIEKEKVKDKPSIVICPKTLLYNWQNEVEKFVPDIKAVVIDGFPNERKKIIEKAKKYDLLITGYATIQKDNEIYEKLKIRFNYCILDEAQFIKNYATKNAKIVKKINADYRLALTGTPLENSVSEIWSIFDFLMPGFLGSHKLFLKKFQNPIMKHSSALALNSLRKKTECFMLRRVKSEVLKELPPKVEQVSRCHLGKAQSILYQEILVNVKNDIFKNVEEKGFNKSRIHILAGLVKLRQICNHPTLLLKDKDYTKYESTKLNMFLELIDEIVENKKKVLVFSQFTKMLGILAQELAKKGIKYSYLSGKTKNRQDIVENFNKNENEQVFLISLRAGGVGLNLTSAENVIIFDPWWNPSVENQAVDRAHRIGQKNSVNVYRLITEGTIEEKIVKLQEKKKFLFDNLVGESKNLFTKLTWNDIKDLFE